jgi:translation initiation factor 3 subunit A
MSTHTNAENIKSRVESFLETNQEKEALGLIYSYLILKRKNWQWTQALEKLMLIYIDLCLNLDEDERLKIGLNCFKDCVQHHHQESLRIVLEKYISTTENQFSESCKLIGEVEEFFEELHQETNANDFYLNSLNLEKGHAKEKVKKSWVTLTNAYKRVLNLVYKNKSLLEMYSSFALRAFKKCAELKALEDFKNLCRVLRLNLKYVAKPKNEKKVNYKFNENDTSDILISLRHQLFDITWDLKLMQESFNILEELNELMRARSKVNLDMQINYYSKLNEVFYKGEFVLFHAVALMEYFSCLVRKKEPESKLKSLANRVVLAVLSIGRNSEEFTLSESLKNKYCIMFSSRQHMPSLSELINGLATSHLLRICSPETRELYKLYTGKFDLFEFSDVLKREVAKVPEQFSQYVEGIKDNCVSIILQLVSDFFKNISFEDLKEFTSFVEFEKVQQEILLLEYTQELEIFLNFEEQLVEFGEKDMDKDDWLLQHEHFLHKLEDTIAVADSLRKDESKSLNMSQLENAYVFSFQDIENVMEKEMKEIKKQNENKVHLSKVKPKETVIDPEEERKREIEKKRREGKQKVDVKILNMKKDKIREILKINPKMKLLEIPLRKLKNDELRQLDLEIFDTIHDKLEEQNKIKANEELKEKYKKFDYLMRYSIQDEKEQRSKKNDEPEIDPEEIQKQKNEILEKEQKQRKELEKGYAFMVVFKKRLLEKRQQEFEDRYAEFRSNLNEEYRNKIYEKAKDELAKKKKKEEEERKKNSRGMFQNRNNMRREGNYTSGVEKPAIIQLTRGSNFKPGESSFQSKTTLARKGESFVPTRSRGFGNSSRTTTGDQSKPTGPITLARRGENFGNKTFTRVIQNYIF